MTVAALQELVARVALKDDTDAYKKLFLHFHARLLTFSYAITHNKESSEELVSDVFIKVWTVRHRLVRISNFPLYLYVSTKNASLNYLARQKKPHAFSLDEVKTDFVTLSYNPEQMLITAEMFRRICAAVQSLPPKCRLIFKLVREDNLRYKEVAELLHLSVKTVENQMAIALRKLGESALLQQQISLS